MLRLAVIIDGINKRTDFREAEATDMDFVIGQWPDNDYHIVIKNLRTGEQHTLDPNELFQYLKNQVK